MSLFSRDDEVVRRARGALRIGKYELANQFFAEYCDRRIRDGLPIGGSLLADYALAVAHLGDLKEAAEMCFRALSSERRNPDVFAALARIYAMGSSRKKAIEAIERGLALSPHHPRLLDLRAELGVRRPPPIPFLPRDSRWNIWLGRAIGRLRPRARRIPA
ncbi:MAG: tetratricopeptide repeat protein [Acidobacteriota bacterium]